MSGNGLPLGEVANFVTEIFLLKIKFLAKRKREFTVKFAILPNGCYAVGFFTFWKYIVIKHSIFSDSIGIWLG
jgi:hypothetical protein